MTRAICPKSARALSRGVNPAVEKFESRKADSGVNTRRERASGSVSSSEGRFGEVSCPLYIRLVTIRSAQRGQPAGPRSRGGVQKPRAPEIA